MNTTPAPTKIGGGTGANLAMICIGEPDNSSLPVWVVNGASIVEGIVGGNLTAELPDGTPAFEMDFYGPAIFDWSEGERTCIRTVDANTDDMLFIQLLPRMADPEFAAVAVVPNNARAQATPPVQQQPAA